jgi:acyl carrier protein
MTISSRTPEGTPHCCPICGQVANLEPSYPDGDSVCPACGHLLWLFRDRVFQASGAAKELIKFETSLRDELGIDSLDLVELIMELEEETGTTIPAEVAERFKSVRDVIEYLRRRQ